MDKREAGHEEDIQSQKQKLKEAILSIKQVTHRVSLSNVTMWKLLQLDEEFPQPIRSSPDRIGWRESAIETWINSQGKPNIEGEIHRSHAQDERTNMEITSQNENNSFSHYERKSKPWHIGHVIYKERTDQGMSQTELAKKAGLGKVTISDVEHNKRSPRLDSLTRIAQVLGYSLAQLASLIPDQNE